MYDVSVPRSEYVETQEQAKQLLKKALDVVNDPDNLIGYDTETKGKKIPIKSAPLDAFTDTVTYWSLSFKHNGEYGRWCLPVEHLQLFSPLLENPKTRLAGWNAKYDAHVSWNCGIDIFQCGAVIDGVALAQTHDENRHSHGLKSCAPDWIGINMTSYLSLFDGVRDSKGKKAKEYETSLVELVELGHRDRVADYASLDAYAHLRLVEWLIEKTKMVPIGNRTLWDYFYKTEVPYTKRLWIMERIGMGIDVPYLKSQVKPIEAKMAELERKVFKTVGEPINLNSPSQLAKYFFSETGLGLTPIKVTGKGAPSVDEEVMNALAEAGVEVAKDVLECRHLGKIKGTYMDSLIALADYYPDKRIHPTFNQLGARTGRLSSKDPNSTNMPRPDNDEWGIRRSFIPREGYVYIVADYEQIEMRIMADRAGDENMLGAINDGKDLHSFTVSKMTPGVMYEEVVAAKKAKQPDARQKWLKTLRQDNKAVGFGIIYGAGPPTISEQIQISEEDWKNQVRQMSGRELERKATRLMKNNPLLTEEKSVELVGRYAYAAIKIEDYFKVFPKVKQYMEETPLQCRMELLRQDWDFDVDPRYPGARLMSKSGHTKPFGYVRTLTGRLRRLEDIDGTGPNAAEAKRQAVNATIQGSAADIIKAAMLRIGDNMELTMLGVELINQVHDELVFEVPKEHADRAAPIIKEHMEHPFYPEEALVVPIPADLKIVTNWADAK
jgi:DNA polymerase-1